MFQGVRNATGRPLAPTALMVTLAWLSRPFRPFPILPVCRFAGLALRLCFYSSCFPVCSFSQRIVSIIRCFPFRGPRLGSTGCRANTSEVSAAHIYIYIYMCIYTYTHYVCIYIYIYTAPERRSGQRRPAACRGILSRFPFRRFSQSTVSKIMFSVFKGLLNVSRAARFVVRFRPALFESVLGDHSAVRFRGPRYYNQYIMLHYIIVYIIVHYIILYHIILCHIMYAHTEVAAATGTAGTDGCWAGSRSCCLGGFGHYYHYNYYYHYYVYYYHYYYCYY